jgi:hypothetical protein
MEFSILNTTPVENSVMGLVRELFDGLTVEDSDSIFTQYNAVDRQMWTFLPPEKSDPRHGQIVCYDVDTETANTISTSGDISPILFTGSGSVVRSTIGKTGVEDWWWMLGTPGGRIALMHVMRSSAAISDRFGKPYAGEINYGPFGSPPFESMWTTHQVEMSSLGDQACPVSVRFYARKRPLEAPTDTIISNFTPGPPKAVRMALRGSWIDDSVSMASVRGRPLPALLRKNILYHMPRSMNAQFS